MSCESLSVRYLMKKNHPYMRWGRDVLQQWSVLDLYDAQLRSCQSRLPPTASVFSVATFL